jgi:hypothetical protein
LEFLAAGTGSTPTLSLPAVFSNVSTCQIFQFAGCGTGIPDLKLIAEP